MRKAKFSWMEPRTFRIAERTRTQALQKWWLNPVFTLGGAAIFLVVMLPIQYLKRRYHLHGAEDIPSLPVSALLSLCFTAFFVYGLPWLYWIFPSTIKVFENSILRVEGQKTIPYDQIRAFSWTHDQDHRVLTLVQRNSRSLRIGVPAEVAEEAITSWLCSRGLLNEPETTS